MGRYDDITPDALLAHLRAFAQLIEKLDREGRLLQAAPQLLDALGDLRARIFAYEVRITGRLSPKPKPEVEDTPQILESRRIIEEAIRRSREAEREWGSGSDPDEPS